MTRKRFVKLLMAQGMQRNEAQKIAQYVQEDKLSYNEAITYWRIKDALANFGTTFAAFIERFNAAVVKVSKAINAFAEALREEEGEQNG